MGAWERISGRLRLLYWLASNLAGRKGQSPCGIIPRQSLGTRKKTLVGFHYGAYFLDPRFRGDDVSREKRNQGRRDSCKDLRAVKQRRTV